MDQSSSFTFSPPGPQGDPVLLAPPVFKTGAFLEEFNGHPGSALGWQQLKKRLRELEETGLAKAWRRGEDLLRENALGNALMPGRTSESRRWDLDPIPFVLSEGEFDQLARKAEKRATLLNAVLQDCYGSQDLVSHGLLPLGFVHGSSEFDRSMVKAAAPDQTYLHFYAVDLARGPDSTWQVVADHTGAPAGLGFALENRIVLSRVWPETRKTLNLIRLADFFRNFSSMLHGLAPAASDTPRVAILSPGPDDPTYLEDAFLARYLGLPLATGPELTVRKARVFLKTVDGLQRIHVLFRRRLGAEIDPLEHPPGPNSPGTQGLPGLMQAVREGTVTLVNPPGTSVVQQPDLANYLDPIARHLRLSNPLPTADLNNFQPSLAPAWDGQKYVAREACLRLFLHASPKGYQVMPGGLVTTPTRPGDLPNATSHAKDLWVCADPSCQVSSRSNLPKHTRICRIGSHLSSQAASDMLWLGRQSERAEFVARVVLAITEGFSGEQDHQKLPFVPPLVRTLARNGFFPSELAKNYSSRLDRTTLISDLGPVVFDTLGNDHDSGTSLPGTIRQLRRLATLSRNRLSIESWRIVQELEETVNVPCPGTRSGMREVLQRLVLLHSAFNGTCRENLTRSQSWSFLNIGRRLERANWTVHLTQEVLSLYPLLPPSILDALLTVADCQLTYRYRYQGSPEVIPALDLILQDPENPRSLAFQLADLDATFNGLPRPKNGAVIRPAHAIVRRGLSFLETEIMDLEDSAGVGTALGKVRHFITKFAGELPEVQQQIDWEFFTHATYSPT